ncbi:MAG: hypothetical protein HC853_08165 [Anaerolineae bacterium]|nr:hypothetical protein [Anaerolineae bacterium]
MAKILWLDWEVPYVTQRIKEAAAQLGFDLAAREINDFVFGVDTRTGSAGVFEGRARSAPRCARPLRHPHHAHVLPAHLRRADDCTIV